MTSNFRDFFYSLRERHTGRSLQEINAKEFIFPVH